MGKISYWSIRSDFSSNDHVAAHIFHIFPFRGSFPDFSYFRLSNDLRHFSYNIVVLVFCVCGRYWMFSVDINAWFFFFFSLVGHRFFSSPEKYRWLRNLYASWFCYSGCDANTNSQDTPPPFSINQNVRVFLPSFVYCIVLTYIFI